MSLLDPSEQDVVDRLAGAWNAFVQLETIHPDEQTEFRHAIHAAQAIIMARPVQREFNGQSQEDAAYQAFVEECAKHCRCTHGPCDACLAGAPCDEIIEDREGVRHYDEEDDQ